MEKRRSMRKPVNLLAADLIFNGNKYPGVIEDVCEHGMKFIAASKKSIASFVPEKVFELKLRSDTSKVTCLNCEVRWVHINKTPIHGLTYRMGMEVVQHSAEFGDVLRL